MAIVDPVVQVITGRTEANTFNYSDQFQIADFGPVYFLFQNFLFFFLIFKVQVQCPIVLARLQLDGSKNRAPK